MQILRKPEWLKIELPGKGEFKDVKHVLRKYGLHTVCEEARCPNLGECWGEGTATFMILGNICTRHCKFCATKTGNPHGIIDSTEPERVKKAVEELNLKYVVLTSVTRDDLPDQGATIYGETIKAIKSINKNIHVEVLTPDFYANPEIIEIVINTGLDVFAHNVETVKRLTRAVRDRRFSYEQSLETLKIAKDIRPDILTKSGFMVGLGETEEEIVSTMEDIKKAGCKILTIGQYLMPSRKHLPVKKYYTPEEFKKFQEIGLKMGYKFVASGPLVRSSYRAGEIFTSLLLDKPRNRE